MGNPTEKTAIKVHKADLTLQGKIGTGPLDEQTVAHSQKVMDETSAKIDFAPMALGFLDTLEKAIADAKSSDEDMKETVKAMTTPVMELKANASTFRYNLIGNMANVMLSFLEGIEQIDKDVIAIVSAHHQTLKAIILKKMQGDGGAIGKQMQDELQGACKRYFAKRKS